MAKISLDHAILDYETYRFGRRQRLFRGPAPDLKTDYIAYIGAEQTFGKFVEKPYPTLVQEDLGLTTLNLGVEGAGPGFFLNDPVLLEACCRAKLCVIEVTSAWNLSNRLYDVGRRYNRRLRGVSETLKGLYPDSDFESFDFIGRMLEHLHNVDPDRFKIVENECRAAWVARMRQLLEAVETKTVLFWFSEREPGGAEKYNSKRARVKYPDSVDQEMLEQISPFADATVECVFTKEQRDTSPSGNQKASENFPPQAMHLMGADLLAEEIEGLLSIQ